MAAAKEERGFSALNALGLGDSAEIGKRGLDLLLNPKWATYLVPFLLVVETVLCSLIIRTVGCTSKAIVYNHSEQEKLTTSNRY